MFSLYLQYKEQIIENKSIKKKRKHKEARVAMLTSYELDFKAQSITRNRERFCNDKGGNLPGRNKNNKCISA